MIKTQKWFQVTSPLALVHGTAQCPCFLTILTNISSCFMTETQGTVLSRPLQRWMNSTMAILTLPYNTPHVIVSMISEIGTMPIAPLTQPTTMDENPVQKRLKTVKHIIIVLSGKGGVGKSSVSSQLALNLYRSSPTARVGILDIDLTGPSIPRMLGVDGKPVHQSTEGWVPVYADGPQQRLGCMSVGFLVKKRGDSVVWRGPKKNGMIRQFLTDVRWGELDYLVVDTPPGDVYFIT
jgi:Mrp family chromosome partitioning ATPase